MRVAITLSAARVRWIGLSLGAALALGCGSPQKPAETASEGSSATGDKATNEAPAEATEAKSSETPASSGSESPPASSANTDNTQPLSKVCEKMCDSLAPKCTKDQVKTCRLSYCAKYVPDQAACDGVARDAFACAQHQKDFLLCSNVVPESCAKKFVAVDKCSATGVAPEREQEGDKIPDGFARFDARDAGFTVVMPKGIETKTEAGVKTWTSKAGDVTYQISLQQPPANEKKFDQKAFVRIAGKLLGRCADKMKLFALVEKETHTLIHYKSQCPDKSQLRGVYYVEGNEFFILRASWTDGTKPDADTFAYSFERKK